MKKNQVSFVIEMNILFDDAHTFLTLVKAHASSVTLIAFTQVILHES